MFPPSPNSFSTASEVHAWEVRLAHFAAATSHAHALLADDEKDRAKRFQSRADRDRYTLSHAIVRVLLAGYVNAEPTDLEIRRQRNGKPHLLNDPGLYFNLSHSADVLALAVTRTGEVGIDVEVVREIPDVEAMARSVMSAREFADFSTKPAERRSPAFLECWTRKESLAKAMGSGLGEVAHAAIEPGLAAQWETRDVSWPDCVAALTVRRSSTPIIASVRLRSPDQCLRMISLC